jgi:glycosyltransferase involved in cell wall biosynthesis
MQKSLPKIDILMATYNGSAYIDEQIQSILDQTYKNIHLYIRDDLSTDNTVAIINKFQQQYPNKITIVPSKERLGVIRNFSFLMEQSTADYIMLSDQDDVWLADKVQITLTKMQELETQHGQRIPLLVHTDLKVVDQQLNPIFASFWEYAALNVRVQQTFPRLLMQNIITGCAMMMNRSLVKLAAPIPPKVIMHDWWIALVAAAFGAIGCVHQPTMLYRQHSNNQVGAKRSTFIRSFLINLSQPRQQINRGKEMFLRLNKQANAFRERYGVRLKPHQQEIINDFCRISPDASLRNAALICKHGFYKSGWARNVQLIICASTMKFLAKNL